MKKLVIAALIATSTIIAPVVQATNYTLQLDSPTIKQAIDIDSIKEYPQGFGKSGIHVTFKFKDIQKNITGTISCLYKYNHSDKTITKTPIVIYADGKMPYFFDNAKVTPITVVGSLDYVFANYAYYKLYGAYFSNDYKEKYGTRDIATIDMAK